MATVYSSCSICGKEFGGESVESLIKWHMKIIHRGMSGQIASRVKVEPWFEKMEPRLRSSKTPHDKCKTVREKAAEQGVGYS